MEMIEYLRKHYMEPMPKWLENFQPGQPIDINEVLKSRIVYYPGAGEDGQPVKTCMKSSSSHVFIYVDFDYNEFMLEEALHHVPFNGYHVIDTIRIPEREIFQDSIYSNDVTPEETRQYYKLDRFFCVMKIFERDDDKTETHGSKRFALISIHADGIASYKSIFGGRYARKPFMVVLQDHGFGGNYNKFGAGGLMEQIANEINVFPELYIVGSHTDIWQGCSKCECEHVLGGMHNNERYLYKQ